MSKYLIVIARYNDWRQHFFEQYFSPRNREYCDKWGFNYIEIKNDTPLDLFRGNPTWWKFTIVRDMIKQNLLKDGDIVTHLDADMAIVDLDKEYITSKSFSYSIDSGNSHCMGNYSIRINDWSKKMIDLILDDDRYLKLNDKITRHDAFGHYSSFWHEFREQASWYSLAGIKRHSWEPFWNLPNYGWHSDINEFTVYSLDELNENVEVLPTIWNVTELDGETEGTYNINKVKKEEVIIRHFSGGQPWRKEWLDNKKNTNKIKEITICLHCGVSRDIVNHQMSLLKPLESEYKIFWNNRIDRHPESYDSYSELINDAVNSSPTEYVILINDRCHPKPHEAKHIIDLLENGYAAATKYSVGFMGFSKQLLRKIGFWDERFYGGGFEDDDFVLRLRLNDLAYYESEESTYDMNWQTNLRAQGGEKCVRSEPHFYTKWRHSDIELRQVIPDETYDKYNLGEHRNDISDNWKNWSDSQIGIFFRERMLTNNGGPSRTYHFRNDNGFEYRKVSSDFIKK